MSLIQLSAIQQRELLKQPESGMGYQWVEYEIPGARAQLGFVVNAEYLLSSESIQSLVDWRNALRSLQAGQRFVQQPALRNLRVTALRPAWMARREALAVKEEAEYSGPASEAVRELSGQGELFVRFSTFKNDHRITEHGGLLPNSYATTLADSKNVSTGSDAVQRYALPNDDPAVFLFDINPMEQTLIKRGVAQENFGKPGGGVEVIFCLGTKPGTVSLSPRTIPA